MKGEKLTDTAKLRGQNKDSKQHRNKTMTKSWRWQYRGMKQDDRDEASAARPGVHSRQREQRKIQQRDDMQVDNSMTEKKGKCRWSRWLSMVARKEEKWKTLKEKLIVKKIPQYYTTPLYFPSLHWSVTFPSLQASE